MPQEPAGELLRLQASGSKDQNRRAASHSCSTWPADAHPWLVSNRCTHSSGPPQSPGHCPSALVPVAPTRDIWGGGAMTQQLGVRSVQSEESSTPKRAETGPLVPTTGGSAFTTSKRPHFTLRVWLHEPTDPLRCPGLLRQSQS